VPIKRIIQATETYVLTAYTRACQHFSTLRLRLRLSARRLRRLDSTPPPFSRRLSASQQGLANAEEFTG
jgi:hypothetical protein